MFLLRIFHIKSNLQVSDLIGIYAKPCCPLKSRPKWSLKNLKEFWTFGHLAIWPTLTLQIVEFPWVFLRPKKAPMQPTTGGEEDISPADLGPSGGFGEHARLCLIQTWRPQWVAPPIHGCEERAAPVVSRSVFPKVSTKGGNTKQQWYTKSRFRMSNDAKISWCHMISIGSPTIKKCWKSRFPMFGNHRTICLDQITLIRPIQPMEILTSIIAHPRKNSMPTWQNPVCIAGLNRSEVKDPRKTMLLLSL